MLWSDALFQLIEKPFKSCSHAPIVRCYILCAGAMYEIGEYIGIFYNRQRRQARLGYMSPAAYTQQFTRQQHAA